MGVPREEEAPTRGVGPGDRVGVCLLTENGAMVVLGPPGPDGFRSFHYRPGTSSLGEARGRTRLTAPLRVGEAPRIGRLRLSRVVLMTRLEDDAALRPIDPSPETEAHQDGAVASALASYADRLHRLRGGADCASVLEECELLATALHLQHLLGSGQNDLRWEDLGELTGEAGTTYVLVARGRRRNERDLLRIPPSGRPRRFEDVDIGPQRVVLRAPLVFFSRSPGAPARIACYTGPIRRVKLR